jgi:hypothetical protein
MRDLMHQYNVSAPFDTITINTAEPFLEIQRRNQYLLIAMDYCTK